jgi:hypothetical protein
VTPETLFQAASLSKFVAAVGAMRQGLVVMTNSDNGSLLAEALIRRAASIFAWPPLGTLGD